MPNLSLIPWTEGFILVSIPWHISSLFILNIATITWIKRCVNDEINMMSHLNAVSKGEETLEGSSCVSFPIHTQQKVLYPKMLYQFLDSFQCHGRLVQSPLFCHFHTEELLRKMGAMLFWRLGYSEQYHTFVLRSLFSFCHQG